MSSKSRAAINQARSSSGFQAEQKIFGPRPWRKDRREAQAGIPDERCYPPQPARKATRSARVNEASEESFPASGPPAY